MPNFPMSPEARLLTVGRVEDLVQHEGVMDDLDAHLNDEMQALKAGTLPKMRPTRVPIQQLYSGTPATPASARAVERALFDGAADAAPAGTRLPGVRPATAAADIGGRTRLPNGSPSSAPAAAADVWGTTRLPDVSPAAAGAALQNGRAGSAKAAPAAAKAAPAAAKAGGKAGVHGRRRPRAGAWEWGVWWGGGGAVVAGGLWAHGPPPGGRLWSSYWTPLHPPHLPSGRSSGTLSFSLILLRTTLKHRP